VVLRLVDEITVGVLDATDLVNVLLDRKLVLELIYPGDEGGNIGHFVLPSDCPAGVSIVDTGPGLIDRHELRPGSESSVVAAPSAQTGEKYASVIRAARCHGGALRGTRGCLIVPPEAQAGRRSFHDRTLCRQ